MPTILTLIMPPLVALALCLHLGYACSKVALPPELRPFAPLLAPLAGCALFLVCAAALTTLTALTPAHVAIGMAALAVPANVWAFLHGRRPPTTDHRPPTTDHRPPTTDHRPPTIVRQPPTSILNSQFSILNSQFSILNSQLVVCALFAAMVLALAILPPLRWGTSTPIGSNWDAAEFYVPLGRALQLRSQRDITTLPRNPLVHIFSIPPVSGRIHAFSYLHAAVSTITGIEPLRSYAPVMAFVLALLPLAVYPLACVLGLRRGAALLAAGLVALAWLPLWVAYNNFSNHLMALPLLPAALAGSLVALRAGGWRALTCGALFTAALATAYYPAMTAYLALLGPAALYLLLRRPTTDDRRPTTDDGHGGGHGGSHGGPALQGRDSQFSIFNSQFPTPSPLHPFTPSPRWVVVRRGLALAALAFVFSGAAQVYFFLHPGFLEEILRGGAGFQVNSFVGLPDALGLAATFNRETLPGEPGLVGAAVALALLLGAAGLAGRRAPALAAMAAGATVYQAFTWARAYHYGFYKGVTFEIPIYALLIAAGAALAWEVAGRRPAWRILGRAAIAAGLALIVALNVTTVWHVQQRYTAAGPQLWTAAEADVAEVRGQVPPAASVLVVPSPAHAPTFNSLISYALLGHELAGQFKTGYDALDAPSQAAEVALLPEETDPSGYGYQSEEVRWAGAGMRLYGRTPGVRYHRALGEGGRYPALGAGATLALRLGPDGIALPGEATPAGSPRGAQLTLALASFGPTTLELTAGAQTTRYDLPGGLVEISTATLSIPGEVLLRNTGAEAAYLWWGELRDGAEPGLTPRDEVFAQVLAQPADGQQTAAAEIQLHTQALPDGRQKLTGLLTVAYTPGNESDWHEVGQWVFFPSGGRRLRLDTDLARLTASLSAGAQPVDLFGAAQPVGDGEYQMTLLLANNARIIYGTTLWTWRMRDGQAEHISADSVLFDVVPLPRPATPQQAESQDGTIRLRGYTMPRRKARPGETLTLNLIWQSLRRLDGDLQARVTLRDAGGRILAEQALPIGAQDHGTTTWQEGELAEQSFVLALPAASPGAAALTVELIAPDGQARPFAGQAGPLKLLDVEITR